MPTYPVTLTVDGVAATAGSSAINVELDPKSKYDESIYSFTYIIGSQYVNVSDLTGTNINGSAITAENIDIYDDIPNYYDHIDIQIQYTIEVPKNSDNCCEPDDETGGYPFDVVWDCKMDLIADYDEGYFPPSTNATKKIIQSDNSDVASGNLKDYSTLVQRFYGKSIAKPVPFLKSSEGIAEKPPNAKFLLPPCKFTFSVENKLGCAIGFSNIITKIAFLYYKDKEDINTNSIKNAWQYADPINCRMNYAYGSFPYEYLLVNVGTLTQKAYDAKEDITGVSCNGIVKETELISDGGGYATYRAVYRLTEFDASIANYIREIGNRAAFPYSYAIPIAGDSNDETAATGAVSVRINDIAGISDWIPISDTTTITYYEPGSDELKTADAADINAPEIGTTEIFKFGKGETNANQISIKSDNDIQRKLEISIAYNSLKNTKVAFEEYFNDPMTLEELSDIGIVIPPAPRPHSDDPLPSPFPDLDL